MNKNFNEKEILEIKLAIKKHLIDLREIKHGNERDGIINDKWNKEIENKIESCLNILNKIDNGE